MRWKIWCFLLVAGCGQAGSSSKPNSSNSKQPSVASLADESCPGFTLIGLKYSPGGTVLPHTCKAFDTVTNNPYAVRCVDAMPTYKTKFPGDEFCILPPPPDKGVQVGAHPQGASYWDKMWAGDFSDYSNAELTKPYEMPPETEVVQNYYTTADNEQGHKYFRIDTRMRPGSHHLVSWFPRTPAPDGWAPLSDQSLLAGTPFYNVQSTRSDRPSAIEIAPEDKGLGMAFPAKTPVTLQLHHINAGNGPMLRETWINVWWLPDGETVTPVQVQALNAPINYPPNQVIDNTHTAMASGDTRIVSVFGHRHAWTTRFSASITRADGTSEDLYESFSWLEMPTYQFDSVTTNPAPDVARPADGALSGLTTLHAGDQVSYTCHAETTAAEAAKLGVPAPAGDLTFGNESFGAEMCVLYLETTGAPLSYGAGQTQAAGQQ
jgi:hypothetical protein